jgi:nucleotide-binding universal stress UspA family protein
VTGDAREFVVVGLDGSPSGDAALDWAAAEAAARGLPLRIVHAHVGVPGSGAQGRRLLQAAADRVAGQVPDVETDLVAGPPVRVLLAAARDAALLVIGVRGVHGTRHARLGTVATTLTHLAGCPVVVTRERENATTGRHVVVGLDAATGSPQALRFALDEAERRHLPLTLLAVLASDGDADEDPEGGAGPATVASRGREAVRSALGVCAAHPAVQVTPVVEGAPSPTRVLVDHGRDAALLVVGARPLDDPRTTLSVSGAVLLHATCTVAVVRDR